MRKLGFLLVAFMATISGFAQKHMSIEDAIIGRGSYLYPKMLKLIKWQDDKHYIAYKNDTVWQYVVGKDSKQILLDSAMINQACLADEKTYAKLVPVKFEDADNLLLRSRSTFATYNLKANNFSYWTELPAGAEVADFCEANHTVAYAKGKNLFIKTGEKETQISHETKDGILVGRTVHRNEFGISKGTFWSPSGKYLAFYRKDESMVKEYPLTNYMLRQAENKPIRYPMAGLTSHQVTIGIFNTETGKTTYLQSGTPDDHYLTNISWGPNEEYIYVAELNRDQNDMHLNQYRVNDGAKINCLIHETRDTYVEPQHPIVFLKKHPNQFIYWTRNDGYFHLYLYNTNGELIKQITKGDWEVTEFYGLDSNEKYAYIQSTKNSPIDRNIYRVNLKSGAITQIDGGDGFHKANFSPSFANYIDTWSAHDVPGMTDLRVNSGKFIKTISKAENTLADYEIGETKLFTLKAADGKTDLYATMTLPNNFDPNKKYPAIIYVYGGPHAQLITNTWCYGTRWWYYYMASKGYIMLTVDSRGSANRGQAFEEVIHRQLGVEETKDQMEGIKYLKSLGYVDMNRIGVHGWSFGGFMTTNLMLRHPETFKVGVAGGPVVDWSMYEVMYGERYMDTPEENPEGYKECNMVNHVKDLKGKLLYIHGAQDNTVVPQHSMKFLRECIKEDKPIDFFTYPTHPHNVIGKDRVHLMKKVSQYFFDYL
ncbi:MAG: DPP IV N-terminal domain-containing protein [Mangrovibacterium sp.]